MRGGVFICHASDDAGAAQRAVAALEAAGVPCWIAPRDIDPGESYTQAILDALEAAPAIVLMFSSATNESPHVTRELETAVGSGRPLVPVRLEPVEPSRSLRYFIGTSHWLEATTGRGGHWTPSLVLAVRRALDAPPAAAPPAPRAPAAPVPAATGTADVAVPTPPLSRAGRQPLLLGAGLVAAVVLGVVVTLALTRGGDDDGGGGSAARQPAASGGGTSASGDATTPVTCWDNSAAADAAHCPVPTGRAGMATVFPGLTDDCTVKDSPIEGKAEVYECVHDGYLVRYTRWDQGYDKESYYNIENVVDPDDWTIQGEEAGLQWWSVDEDPEETQPYQWSAAYADWPFSLSVEGDTQADRSDGVAGLALVAPDHIGLK